MTYEQINEMVEEMDLPFAYHHFAEGESPQPPFLVWLSPNTENFGADNKMYHEFKIVHIELYTDKRDFELEKQVEQVLKAHHIFFNKSEVWIDTEKMFEVLFEMKI